MQKELKQELISYIKRLGVTDLTASETIAHDVLLDSKAKGYEFRNAKYRVMNYFNTERNYKSSITGQDRIVSVYLDEELNDSESGSNNLLDITPADTSNEDRASALVEQRRLIRDLTRNSDERTELIVETWLSLDRPTFTEVADIVGSNRKTVQRCISRLSRNYDEQENGSIYDYLTV